MGTKPILSIDQRILLDRLYNLKGEDSEILREIRERIAANKTALQVLSDEASDLKNQKDTITSRKGELDSQYAKILEDLKGISRESYSTVLDEAHEEFDPEAMLERIKEKIPSRLEEICTQIDKIEEDIAETKKKINENEIDSTELEEKLTDALQMQERLVKLIDESLHGNGSITRDSVQELLIGLGFAEEDTIELGKMILFPQGTLSEYEKEYQEKQNRGKSIQEVFSDAMQAGVEEQEVVEEVQPEVEEETIFEPTEEVIEEKILEEPQPEIIEPVVEVVEEETIAIEEPTKSAFFEETTIAEGLFSQDVVDFLEGSNKNELIKKNIEILRSLEIKEHVLSSYYSVLLDEELEDKIKFFQDELLKAAKDIELNFEILLVYSYEDLKALQSACQEYELDMSRIPLFLMRQGLQNFFANLEFLTSKGVELDNNEVYKFMPSLFIDSNQFQNNYEMVNKYQYTLAKKNGKTAVQVMAKDSAELATGLDTVIENGDEKVFESFPEKMSSDLIGLANRIVYCKQNGVPIIGENGTVHKFLFDEEEFAKVFEGVDPKSFEVIPTAEEAKANIQEVLNNSTLIEVLGTMDLANIYLTGRDIANESIYFELLDYNKSVAEKAEATDRTYTIDGVVVSKERFERNLLFLLNNGIDASTEELLTTALLHGTRKSKEDMKRVADKMGFNAPAVGGVQL